MNNPVKPVRWLYGHEVIKQLGINDVTLKSYVLNHELTAYDPNTLLALNVEDLLPKEGVMTLRQALGQYGAGLKSVTIEDKLLKSVFKSDDVENLNAAPQHDTTPHADQAPTTPQVEAGAVNFFTMLDNKHWQIGFNGKKAIIDPLAGILYIAYLLEKPGTSILCGELYQAASGKAPDNLMSEAVAIGQGLNIGSSKQAGSDYKAKKDYWREWKELQNEIDNAEDTPEGEMVRKESKKQKDNLEHLLNERNFADPNAKKVQINVKKRLDAAYKAIGKAQMKELAKYLQKHIKPDGAYDFVYSGSTPWEITYI